MQGFCRIDLAESRSPVPRIHRAPQNVRLIASANCRCDKKEGPLRKEWAFLPLKKSYSIRAGKYAPYSEAESSFPSTGV